MMFLTFFSRGSEDSFEDEERNLPQLHRSPPRQKQYIFDEDVINVGALTYRTSNYCPNEFVIHPEWRNRNDLIALYNFRQKDEHSLIPRYGYWRR